MLRFRSLIAKFIFIGIVMLTFITAYVTVTYIFTHHIKGEATMINLAGKERMLSYMIAFHMEQIVDIPPSPERTNIIELNISDNRWIYMKRPSMP